MEVGTVLVTGANRGIGLELIKQFVGLPKPPKYVFAGCRSPDKAEELKSMAKTNPSLRLIKLDVGDHSSIQSAAREVSNILGDTGLNLLINNAGMFDSSEVNLDVLDPEKVVYAFRVMALGPMLMAKEFAPMLRRAAKANPGAEMGLGRAVIFGISSQGGSTGDGITFPGYYSYTSSKCAMNNFNNRLAVELNDDGILAVVVCPGFVATDLTVDSPLIGLLEKKTPTQAVSELFTILANLKASDQGKFLRFDGKEIAW